MTVLQTVPQPHDIEEGIEKEQRCHNHDDEQHKNDSVLQLHIHQSSRNEDPHDDENETEIIRSLTEVPIPPADIKIEVIHKKGEKQMKHNDGGSSYPDIPSAPVITGRRKHKMSKTGTHIGCDHGIGHLCIVSSPMTGEGEGEGEKAWRSSTRCP